MAINYDLLVKNIVTPLVLHPEDVLVKTLADDGTELAIQVLVNQEDLGRVIGKGGRIASAIRTIVYAGASKEGKRVNIAIDAF